MAVAGRPSLLRAIGIVAVGVETGLAVVILAYCLITGVSTEAGSINRDIAVFVSGMFALTTAPAAALLLWGRWLWLAAVLAALPVAALAIRFAM